MGNVFLIAVCSSYSFFMFSSSLAVVEAEKQKKYFRRIQEFPWWFCCVDYVDVDPQTVRLRDLSFRKNENRFHQSTDYSVKCRQQSTHFESLNCFHFRSLLLSLDRSFVSKFHAFDIKSIIFGRRILWLVVVCRQFFVLFLCAHLQLPSSFIIFFQLQITTSPKISRFPKTDITWTEKLFSTNSTEFPFLDENEISISTPVLRFSSAIDVATSSSTLFSRKFQFTTRNRRKLHEPQQCCCDLCETFDNRQLGGNRETK